VHWGAKMKKKDMLWEADYRYNFDRDLFVNRVAEKHSAWSLSTISPKKRYGCALGRTPMATVGMFYFNFPSIRRRKAAN